MTPQTTLVAPYLYPVLHVTVPDRTRPPGARDPLSAQSIQQRRVYAHIKATPGHPIPDIAADLMKTNSSVSSVINRLFLLRLIRKIDLTGKPSGPYNRYGYEVTS
jgi:hypothetical protein